MLIEWTHRWIALLVGVVAILLLYGALKARLDRRWVVAPAVAVVVVIGIQAWLGRMVVKGHLERDLVAIHLFVSMIVVALFVIVAVTTRRAVDGPHLLERDWSRQLGVGAISVLFVLILGSIVHNVYVPGWPLVDGAWIPDFAGLNSLAIHWLHRTVSAVVLLYLIFLVWRGAKVRRPHVEGYLVVGATALYAANVGVGLLHVVTEVESTAVVTLHLGLAALVWAALVAATFLSFHDRR